MIQDIFECAGLYTGCCESFTRAIEFARRLPLDTPDGKIDLNGEAMYASVSSYTTKSPGDLSFEAHRKYIDVQVLLSGRERIDVTNQTNLPILQPYAENTDVLFFAPPMEFTSLLLEPGRFVVLFPQDAHRPCLNVTEPQPVRKVVVKIRV
ncbi:MAG: YhcH/YjgK/YiaL family protein [Phycisphaerae bacterium]|nr:YhcH/YjgK/YiaL family protein [Phycisphaerae bacterium]